MPDRTWMAQVRELLNESALDAPKKTGKIGVSVETVRQTPRERQLREINRIASWYGLKEEIWRALDEARVDRVEDLPIECVAKLGRRMRNLEDCLQNGLGPPDAPPGS